MFLTKGCLRVIWKTVHVDCFEVGGTLVEKPPDEISKSAGIGPLHRFIVLPPLHHLQQCVGVFMPVAPHEHRRHPDRVRVGVAAVVDIQRQMVLTSLKSSRKLRMCLKRVSLNVPSSLSKETVSSLPFAETMFSRNLCQTSG